MPWKLKANAPEFDCVDGPLAGKKYRHGELYADVPQGDKGRFESVVLPPKKPAKTQAPKKNAVSEDKQTASVKPEGGTDK